MPAVQWTRLGEACRPVGLAARASDGIGFAYRRAPVAPESDGVLTQPVNLGALPEKRFTVQKLLAARALVSLGVLRLCGAAFGVPAAELLDRGVHIAPRGWGLCPPMSYSYSYSNSYSYSYSATHGAE